METINRVELQGTVGNVRMQEAGERKVLHFSLVTNRVSRNKDGENIVEACWHNVEAWEGKNIADLTKIDKGSNVHLFGRIRYTKYVGADKIERIGTSSPAGWKWSMTTWHKYILPEAAKLGN